MNFFDKKPYTEKDDDAACALLRKLRELHNQPDPPRCDSDDVTLMYWYLSQKLEQLEILASAAIRSWDGITTTEGYNNTRWRRIKAKEFDALREVLGI